MILGQEQSGLHQLCNVYAEVVNAHALVGLNQLLLGGTPLGQSVKFDPILSEPALQLRICGSAG